MEVPSPNPIGNGGKLSSALKHLVALVYVMAPIAYWGYSIYMGMPIDQLVWILVLGYSLASAYVIYGEKTTDKALDEAKDLTGEGDEE